jgi:DNA-binding NarL/FixJ family response regulator
MPPSVSDLAERHIPAFRLLVQGKHNREIAAAYGLLEHTVESYASEIYAILVCEGGRTELIVRALRGDFRRS